MVLSDSVRFLVFAGSIALFLIIGGSWCLLVVLNDIFWVLMVLGVFSVLDSSWVFLGGSLPFLVVLGGNL